MSATAPMTKRLFAGAAAVVALLMASCSGSEEDPVAGVPTPSKVPADAVAIVGDTAIPESGYRVALRQSLAGYDPLSPTRTAPEPLDPPEFGRCVAAIETRAKTDPSLKKLGREAYLSSCEQRYEQQKTLTLSRLIQEEWVRTEADLEGVEVSGQEVDALIDQLRSSWASKPAVSRERFRRAVEASGISPEELRQRAEALVLRQRLDLVEAGEDEAPGPEEAASLERERFDAWRSKTLCAKSLVVPECSNGPAG